MSANLSLFTLPLEIIIRIFGLLEGRQIVRCGAVCTYFKHIIQSSIVLRYFIKLDMFGYTDGSGSIGAPPIPAIRLNRLERHIHAWNNLDWVETRLPAPPHDDDFGILSQGIFATFDRNRVYCIQLPHLMRGIPLRTWARGGFEFPISQIEMDPSNNLLVLVSRAVVHPDRPDVDTVAVHLHTLFGNRPHPWARNHILFSVLADSGYRIRSVVRVVGCFLGITLCFHHELRVEIWNWMTGQKITVLEIKAVDYIASDFCSFEFLSAPFIVVVRQAALEVYQIRPGTPPVLTISFCLPRPRLDEYHSTAWISGKSRLSHGVDRGNHPWGRPFFPPPSFQLAQDSSYLTIQWCVSGPPGSDALSARFHVPLSSLRRAPMYGDALAIPWEVWSKDVYFRPGQMDYEMIGGRLIHFPHSLMFGSRCRVSLSDLNRPRARGPGMISADPWKDYAPPYVIRSNRLSDPGEIRMGCPPPVPLVSRYVSLDGSFPRPRVICDDEHIIFWALKCPVRLAADGNGGGDRDGQEDEVGDGDRDEDGDEDGHENGAGDGGESGDEDEDDAWDEDGDWDEDQDENMAYVDKLIILTVW